jgi:WD40 repeat protein
LGWIVRGRGNLLGGLLAGLVVLLGMAIAIPLNVVSGYFPATVTGHRPLWIGVACGCALAILMSTWLSRQLTHRASGAALNQVPRPVGWVDRSELSEVVSALTAAGAGTIALTTGLVGAGGFGKTTLAARACQDPVVRRRFRGGIVWITIGRDLSGAALAARISDAIRSINGEGPTFTNPEQAGKALAQALAVRGRAMVVVDDVWTAGQLEPFLAVGQGTGRLLVTTRRPLVLQGTEPRQIKVDALTEAVARRLLTRGLPPMSGPWERELLELTGGWPLLLNLVNHRLAQDRSRPGGTLDTAAKDAVSRLRQDPAALDVADSGKRQTAVAATIKYSTDALDACDRDRFFELGVFAEDAEVPVAVIELLWQSTAGLSEAAVKALCERLDGLSLLSLAWSKDARVIVLHDIVRDFLRSELGPQEVITLNGALVDAIAAELPSTEVLGIAGGQFPRVSWWEPNCGGRYLLDHLIEHMLDAHRPVEAEEVACDLRWAGVRLQEFGPAALAADLSLVGTPRAARLGKVLTRVAHLLAPTEPARAVVDILHSQVVNDPDWGPQVTVLRELYSWPRLVSRWPMPDQGHSALRCVLPDPDYGRQIMRLPRDGKWLALIGHRRTRIWDTTTWQVKTTFDCQGSTASAIAPDGSWLAIADDRAVRLWDTSTWQVKATLPGHSTSRTMVVGRDGSWLATIESLSIRVWDTATGQVKTTLPGYSTAWVGWAFGRHGSWLATIGSLRTRVWDTATWRARATLHIVGKINAAAFAPDGSWLAIARNSNVRIWDAARWQVMATLAGEVDVVAVAPDSSWLATSNRNRRVRIWDAARWQVMATLAGEVRVVAVAPDSSWLATSNRDRRVRIWDAARWQVKATLAGEVDVVAVAPDSSWLATAGQSEPVRIYDIATAQALAVLTGPSHEVRDMGVAWDGSWLATSARDGTVRIYDTVTALALGVVTGPSYDVRAMVVAPDRSWLAASGREQSVRVWDTTTGRVRATLSGKFTVSAVAPDGAWLATTSSDGAVQIWDTTTWRPRADCRGTQRIVDTVVAPDGTWTATSDSSGNLRIWDFALGQARPAFPGSDRARAAAVAPDGSWMAVASLVGAVRIYDMTTGQVCATLRGATGMVKAAVAPDGSWMAIASRNGTVLIWDTITWQSRADFRDTEGVREIMVAPDGSWLATIAWGKAMRIWDTVTWQIRATFPGSDEVRAVGVAPDGSSAAISGIDGTMRIYDVATEEISALMRVDDIIFACAWLSKERVAFGGLNGMYMFDFFRGINLA